jgi:hypothetical protein
MSKCITPILHLPYINDFWSRLYGLSHEDTENELNVVESTFFHSFLHLFFSLLLAFFLFFFNLFFFPMLG